MSQDLFTPRSKKTSRTIVLVTLLVALGLPLLLFGALLAGDLDVVRKMVVSEKAQVSKLRDETRLKDLAIFCVSEEYAALREKLGLSVVVPA